MFPFMLALRHKPGQPNAVPNDPEDEAEQEAYADLNMSAVEFISPESQDSLFEKSGSKKSDRKTKDETNGKLEALPIDMMVGPYVKLSFYQEPQMAGPAMELRLVAVGTAEITTIICTPKALADLEKQAAIGATKKLFDKAATLVYTTRASSAPPNRYRTSETERKKYEKDRKDLRKRISYYDDMTTERAMKIDLSPEVARMMFDRDGDTVTEVTYQLQYMLGGLQPPMTPENSRYWEMANVINEEIRKKARNAPWINSAHKYDDPSLPLRSMRRKNRALGCK